MTETPLAARSEGSGWGAREDHRTYVDVPFRVKAVRAGLAVLGIVAPPVAGKTAADLFLRSRQGDRPVLDATPLGAQPLAIPGGGQVRQAYRWGQEGPTVLLIHGWGADSSSMYSLARFLSQCGFRAVAYDAPAHGVSLGRQTTMSEFVQAAGAVMDALEGELCAVVSHSLGAVATVAALSRSSRRRPGHLILLSAPCSVSDVVDDFARYMRLRPGIAARMRADLHRRNGVPVEHWDIRALGRELPMPALILHDREDVLVPFHQAEVIARVFAGSRVELTQGLGHRFILIDRQVHLKIQEFIAKAAA